MNLTKEQMKIIEAPEHKVVVISSAGTSKTTVMAERIRWILRQGGDPHKMVAITFTNNAAEELRERLGDDFKEGMYIGTVHGYANSLLMENGIDTSSIRSDKEFDELFEAVMSHPEVIKPIGWLGLDEAQDSSVNQFEFIFDMLAPTAFFVCGDMKQTIYQFSGAKPELLERLATQEDVKIYKMTENWRSGQNIIDYSNWIAQKLTGMKEQITCMKRVSGEVHTIPERDIINIIKQEGSYGDWAILCRTNQRISSFLIRLQDAGIPCVTFRQAQGSNADLKEKMKENCVKVLTIHSAKGLQWPNVIVADQRWRKSEDINLMYVAGTRPENKLYWVKG